MAYGQREFCPTNDWVCPLLDNENKVTHPASPFALAAGKRQEKFYVSKNLSLVRNF